MPIHDLSRIGSFPKADGDDLFALLQEWQQVEDAEERQSIHRAIEEILAQEPLTVRSLPLTEGKPLKGDRKSWAEQVGRRIRTLREEAGLTQIELARKAGLPQSHISRLENAEHSATSLTLEKIAKALGVSVNRVDPWAE